MIQTILLSTAKTAKWDRKPDIIAEAQQAYEETIASSFLASQTTVDPAYPTDAEIQAAYDANKTQFVIPRQYHIAQIFIASGASSQADDMAKQKIASIRQQLSQPGADFGNLARLDSQDPSSATKGGDLGSGLIL
jgi:parvulin-like peptidyl-prolyl isomerase